MVQKSFYALYDNQSNEIDCICKLWKVIYNEITGQLSRNYPEVAEVRDPYRYPTFFDFLEKLSSLRDKLIHGEIMPLTTQFTEQDTVHPRHPRDIWDFGRLNVLFTFLKKAPLSSKYLELEALQKHVRDELLRSDCFEKLLDVKWIIEEWCNQIPWDFFPCGFGPGVTSQTKRDKASKYANFNGVIPFSALGDNTFIDVAKCGFWRVGKVAGIGKYVPLYCASRPTAVPKTAKGPRIIGPEPVTLGWAQHGVMEVCYRFLSRHSYLRHRCNLYDQTRNQRMTQFGSRTGMFTTVDLHAASDSNRNSLTEWLFEGTKLGELLKAVRTEYMIVPGTDDVLIPHSKYCGMGSAVCFPVESIIFAAVAEAVSRRAGTPKTIFGFPSWSVYGDDIIIYHENFELLKKYLEALGFIINTDKTFSGLFLESCGKECYCGCDVSPVYFRVRGLANKLVTFENYGSYVALVNNLFHKGLPETRKYVLKLLYSKKVRISSKHTKQVVPMYTSDPDDTSAIYSLTRSNKKRVKIVDGKPTWIYEEYGTHVVPEKVSDECKAPTMQPVFDWLVAKAWKNSRQSGEQPQSFVPPRGRLVTRWKVSES